MTLEEIIIAEKEHLVNVLGKKLIDSEERDDRKHGYKILARKYWPEYFDETIKVSGGISKMKPGYTIHHIDFDHSNNVVNNIVVLTIKEHINIHYKFDPSYEGKGCGERNGMYGKRGDLYPEGCRKRPPRTKEWCEHHSKIMKGKNTYKRSEETRKKIGEANKGRFKGKHWKVVDGKRCWY